MYIVWTLRMSAAVRSLDLKPVYIPEPANAFTKSGSEKEGTAVHLEAAVVSQEESESRLLLVGHSLCA